MRRFCFAILWFIVLWIGTGMLGGAIAGSLAARRRDASPAGFSNGFERGYAAGQAAGQEFRMRYGSVILLGALVVSVGGTVLGVLPGTASRRVRRPAVLQMTRSS